MNTQLAEMASHDILWEYLVANLEFFFQSSMVKDNKDEAAPAPANPRDYQRDMDEVCTIQSIIYLIPFVNDTIWQSISPRIYAYTLVLAQTTSQANPGGGEVMWFRLLKQILIQGVALELEDELPIMKFSLADSLEAIQKLCFVGMERSCCINCKYNSEWYNILFLATAYRDRRKHAAEFA